VCTVSWGLNMQYEKYWYDQYILPVLIGLWNMNDIDNIYILASQSSVSLRWKLWLYELLLKW
jgi:hypothetical protein